MCNLEHVLGAHVKRPDRIVPEIYGGSNKKFMAKEIQEKLVEAISQLVESYSELRESAEAEFQEEHDEDEGELDPDELETGIDATIVSELRLAIESVIDSEDFAPDDFAVLLGAMSDALEEIDPDVFEAEIEEDEEVEPLEDIDDEPDLDDEDFDDFDDDDEEDDDYYEDDEEEEDD